MTLRDPLHRETQRTHAIRRAFERYGMVISNREYERILDMIAEGKSIVLGAARTGGEMHEVVLRRRTLIAVYRREDRTIPTFLPIGAGR
jgi:hypothetical protein